VSLPSIVVEVYGSLEEDRTTITLISWTTFASRS
jgi:hypothetical protein